MKTFTFNKKELLTNTSVNHQYEVQKELATSVTFVDDVGKVRESHKSRICKYTGKELIHSGFLK